MPGPVKIELSAAQQQAHAHLLSAIADLAEAGHYAPCLGRNWEAWTAEDSKSQQYAAAHCAQCPALEMCGEYITDFPESSGVYAGKTAAERKYAR